MTWEPNNYRGKLVRKPWGWERQLLDNGHVAVWHLHLEPGQQTSMHLHRRKRTSLIVLSGLATIRFISGNLCATPLDKVSFYPEQYHQTQANGTALELLEVETPSDKGDLVRLEDQYGRAGKGYEGPEALEPCPLPELMWSGSLSQQEVAGCTLRLTCASTVAREETQATVIFLSGGIRRGSMTVSSPGAVMGSKLLRRLASRYDLLPSEVLEVSRA